jgi:hypothetical protein
MEHSTGLRNRPQNLPETNHRKLLETGYRLHPDCTKLITPQPEDPRGQAECIELTHEGSAVKVA